MTVHGKRLGLSAATATFCMVCALPALGLGINYERLSALEEPLAVNIGGWTATVVGLVDLGASTDLHGEADPGLALTANGTVAVERQLRNRWTVRVAYFGQIEADTPLGNGFGTGQRSYTDTVLASVGSTWGTVVVGNASGLVREETRRRRGAGNAALAYDASLAELDDWGAGYRGRYGPVTVTSVIDENGDFDLGAVYQRPVREKDYRVSARYTNGTYRAADDTRELDVQGGGLVGEVIYGSLTLDAGVGYDRLDTRGIGADRAYVSAGAQKKWGAVTLSAEGHYGQIDGQTERAASLGARYDVARGLSVNLGVDYVDSDVVIDGVAVTDDDEVITATGSVRYEF